MCPPHSRGAHGAFWVSRNCPFRARERLAAFGAPFPGGLRQRGADIPIRMDEALKAATDISNTRRRVPPHGPVG
jgi:hypothetical protein